MIFPKVLREDFVNQVIGVVLVHLDLFKNHAAFTDDVFVREDGIEHKIA